MGFEGFSTVLVLYSVMVWVSVLVSCATVTVIVDCGGQFPPLLPPPLFPPPLFHHRYPPPLFPPSLSPPPLSPPPLSPPL